MKLSQEDVQLFYSLYHPLLVYTNMKFSLVEGLDFPQDIRKFSLEDIYEIKKKLYEHPELIDDFASENPLGFSPDCLHIIRRWKHFVQGRFYIVRYLKKYTVFLDADQTSRVYGVLALTSTFEEMLGPYLPILIETTLLPFKGQIIYDSLFLPYSITFGGNIRRSLNDTYQQAKATLGIIISLPFLPEKEEKTDAERLKSYLKNQGSRETYREEIEELAQKNSELQVLYHQEMGKIHARRLKKQLVEIGLKDAWVAILEGFPVASGTTKNEVNGTLQRILPAEKRKLTHIFRIKGS